jgi:hypothetical protein
MTRKHGIEEFETKSIMFAWENAKRCFNQPDRTRVKNFLDEKLILKRHTGCD